MPIYHRFYQVSPSAFKPFNDSPTYISGAVTTGDRDEVILAGRCRFQLQDWYNIGGRTEWLDPESFVFTANACATEDLGAYSVGIVGRNRTSINISHFLRSSTQLLAEDPGVNFYSGFARDDSGTRTQSGFPAPFEPTGRLHTLSVGYDREQCVLECSANSLPMHRVHVSLGQFCLELRHECVGVEGPFKVSFEQLYYYPLLEAPSPNLARLGAWDPQYAPVFVSYSRRDSAKVSVLVDLLKSRGVRVLGDWDFRPGESLIRRISESISRSGYLIVALSPSSVASSWVERELEVALTDELSRPSRVEVLPVIIEDCTIPPFLVGKLYLDLRDPQGDQLERLVTTLRSFGRW